MYWLAVTLRGKEKVWCYQSRAIKAFRRLLANADDAFSSECV